MTFGALASYADITGAPYKRAVVEWMLNVARSQTRYNKRAYVEHSRTSAHRNVLNHDHGNEVNTNFLCGQENVWKTWGLRADCHPIQLNKVVFVLRHGF